VSRQRDVILSSLFVENLETSIENFSFHFVLFSCFSSLLTLKTFFFFPPQNALDAPRIPFSQQAPSLVAEAFFLVAEALSTV
jgi:hypothetical protein